jgi:hypothetical protein
MKILLIVHRNDEALEQFIQAVRQENLAGFTITPSRGVGRTSQRLNNAEIGIGSVLSLLAGSNEGAKLENTTMWSLVQDDRLPRVLELLKMHVSDFSSQGSGLYAVLPVESFGGVE